MASIPGDAGPAGPSPYQQSGSHQAYQQTYVPPAAQASSSTFGAPPAGSGATFDSSNPAAEMFADSAPVKALKQRVNFVSQRYQSYLDQCTPYVGQRWISTVILLFLFMTRVLVAQGWYIVCYALGIYLLNLFLAFLTPKFDPSIEQDEAEQDAEEGTSDDLRPAGLLNGEIGGDLPTRQTDEFKPFIRRLPEFKFWHSATKAIAIAFVCSFFTFFDIPVYWPILLIYFFTLTALTLRRQIRHMVKYKYVPFDLGKARYSRK